MRKFAVTALVCVSLFVFAGSAFAQTGNASLSGTVTDQSGALLPGVTITVTNTETGVVNSAVTNESGVYNFASLQPGTAYRVAASLPGFQTRAITNFELGVASTNRQNFQLSVAQTATTIEVQADANAAITAAGASVGDVLPAARIQNLPLVGNNVLDLLDILPGLRLSPLGSAFDTIGGLGMNSVNTTRDGMSVVDGRYDAQTWGREVLSTTVINPDLVGEIRLILSPIDAELGRGNAQVQIQTRSGTNRYTGSAVWNLRNTALDANTWDNNNETTNGVWTPEQPDWRNAHQYTISFGGPIIRNKTFFFVLWDQNITNTRTVQSPTVLTPTALQGIFRWWTGWNPAAAGTTPTTTPTTNTNPVYPSVDDAGNPVAPLVNPNNTAYTGELRCFSVFGNQKLVGGAMVPFTAADCPGGTAVFNTGGAPWDAKRPVADTTGYIARLLSEMPAANYFGGGDGLNTAQLRYLRGRRGSTNGADAITGTDAFSNRKNINIKIDQHIGAHRISGNWSYQLDDNADNVGAWPDAINGTQRSRPTVVTINATSTLSSTLLNEARWGMNYNDRAELPNFRSPNDTVRAAAESYFLTGGAAANGLIYPVLPNPSAAVGIGNAARTISANGIMDFTPTNIGNKTVLYNYADTLSWTHGKHAFKFGADLNFSRSNGFNLQSVPTLSFGNNGSASSTVGPIATANAFSAQGMTGLPTNSRNQATALSYFLNGSVSGVSHSYWMESQVDKDTGLWQDYSTREQRLRNQISSDYAFFVKDDYKLTPRLTLNLGVRYTILNSPYLESGLTSAPVDLGSGMFGASRGAGGYLFENWLQPGNLFLTNYGNQLPAGTIPLLCANGVTQNTSLPTSNCDDTLLTNLEFVGPNTVNPSKVVIPNDYNNFAPNIGFSYQAPWLGGSGVTVRGGYGITYGSAGRSGITLDTLLGSAPGNALTATLTDHINDSNIQAILATRALNLTDVPTLVPVQPIRPPGATVPIYARSVGFTAYDPNFVTPYTQNITLSLTRQMNRKLTLDLRYIGTLARKQQGSLDLNTSTVFYNPELFDALERTRRGEDVPLFDQMLAGLSLGPASEGYGAVGTCVNQPSGSTSATRPGLGLEGCAANQVMQHGSAHLRRSATLQADLANGDFEGVADSLVTLTATSGHQGLPINPATGQTITGVQQRVLRNGCDRLANGLTNIATRCFPENYLQANPQFQTATYNANINHSNYHSLQLQATIRPSSGMSVQATYAWAKSMELSSGNGFGDPLQRDLDYQRGRQGPHSLRMNGTIELPIGPNKLLFGSSSGWVARLIERWQTSFILNLATGSPADITGAGTMRYGAARMVATQYWQIPKGNVTWDRVLPGGQTAGSWYGTPSPYVTVLDPQCTNTGLVAQTDPMGRNLSAQCDLDALGIIVPPGTPDSQTVGSTSYVLGLLHPTPGNFGTLGPRTLNYWGQFSLDANASKTFRISESKSLQIRIDSRNVLNHPQPDIPSFDLDSVGNIAEKSDDARTFQAQIRLTF